MQGLDLYNKVRTVPQEAKKSIGAGRLKGMTDINPMWRLKILTEQFGPCGIGWTYEITKQWIEDGSDNQKVAFTNINLFIKVGNEWSRAIPGTGGSSFIAKESKGLYTSDECFKMALTDAISVACKALGVGADVYYDKDRTKYDASKTNENSSGTQEQPNKSNNTSTISEARQKRLFAISKGNANVVKEVLMKHGYTSSKDIKTSEYDAICDEVAKKVG